MAKLSVNEKIKKTQLKLKKLKQQQKNELAKMPVNFINRIEKLYGIKFTNKIYNDFFDFIKANKDVIAKNLNLNTNTNTNPNNNTQKK